MDDKTHVARVIRSRLDAFDPLPGTMEDCIVAGSCRRNPDGSLTIRCQISMVDHATGEKWMLDDRTIRLPRSR